MPAIYVAKVLSYYASIDTEPLFFYYNILMKPRDAFTGPPRILDYRTDPADGTVAFL